MEKKKQLEVTYDRAKDILYLQIQPPRPARMDEFEFDFYIKYDWDAPSDIVGFEWLNFSNGYKGLDHINEIKRIETKFDIKNTKLKSFSLREVIDWAYKTYVKGMMILDEFEVTNKIN